MIRRAFADLPMRQVHYRKAGHGPVLLMLHASPGSSKQLEKKIEVLAAGRTVIAPDTPGNGDSPPLPIKVPQISDYAEALVEFMDVLGIGRCDVYGSHTGASIGMELAIQFPGRVGKLVIDGIGLYSDETRAHYLANYAKPMQPTLSGTHLMQAFMFCRDQYLFWPWFETEAKNRRQGGLPSAKDLHEWVLEVCKGLSTYHLSYNAAFAHRSEARLQELVTETLFLAASNDPLLEFMEKAAKLPRRGRLELLPSSAEPQFARHLASALEIFFSAPTTRE